MPYKWNKVSDTTKVDSCIKCYICQQAYEDALASMKVHEPVICFMIHQRTTRCLHVRERALGKNGLSDDTRKGQHSETSVLDLFQFHLLHLLWRLVLEESKGVKAKVSRLASGSIEHLYNGNGVDDLKKAEPEQHLSHGTLLDKGIMGSNGGEALVGLGEGIDFETQIDGDESEPCHHANTSVLDLSFGEEVHGNEIGEAKRVETGVANISLKVRWGREEGKGLAHLGVEGCGGLAS